MNRQVLSRLRIISASTYSMLTYELMSSCASTLRCNCLATPAVLSRNSLPVFNCSHSQNYSKDKSFKKDKKKTVGLREDILESYFNVERIKYEMKNVINEMRDQYMNNVSIRSAAGAIESIPVEYDGQEYTVQDLAQVNRRNPKMVALNFSSFPQTISAAVEAINSSGMNLNAQQDGTSVFIAIPKTTREHREQLAKVANACFTKSKQAVRDVQMNYLRKLEFKDNVSIEQSRLVQEHMVALADIYIAELEKLKNEKVKELLRNE